MPDRLKLGASFIEGGLPRRVLTETRGAAAVVRVVRGYLYCEQKALAGLKGSTDGTVASDGRLGRLAGQEAVG